MRTASLNQCPEIALPEQAKPRQPNMQKKNWTKVPTMSNHIRNLKQNQQTDQTEKHNIILLAPTSIVCPITASIFLSVRNDRACNILNHFDRLFSGLRSTSLSTCTGYPPSTGTVHCGLLRCSAANAPLRTC